MLYLQGFEARGTEIANRLTAWENLLEETRPSGRLTANPNDKLQQQDNVLLNNYCFILMHAIWD